MAASCCLRTLLLLVLVLESAGQYYDYYNYYNYGDYGGYDYGWCPFGINGNCLCEESTVDCTGQGLPALPVGLPSYVTTLILKGNQISSVTTAQLSALPLLEILDLSSNNLQTLPADLFDSLPFLQQINLSDNPWTCDCSLKWLGVWLHEAEQRGVQVLDRDNTRCREWLTVSMLDVLPADFLPCGAAQKSAVRVVRSPASPTSPYINNFSSWNQVCQYWFQKNDCNTGPNEAGSCVYSPDQQTVAVITYSNFTTQNDAGTCRSYCFRSGYGYYAHQNSTYSCLCGQEDSSYSCADCNGSNITSTVLTLCSRSLMRVPSALNVLHDAAITFTSPVVAKTPVTFTISGYPSIVNSFTWDFGDGAKIAASSSMYRHTYFYSGLFPLQVELCGAGVCKEVKVQVRVRDDAVTAELQCPSVSELSSKVSMNLTVSSTDSAEVKWTHTSPDGVTTTVNSCESGWMLFGGKCIQLAGGSEDYIRAQSACQSKGGNLVALSQLQQVHDLPQVLGLTAGESAYIGARYSGSGYRWIINTPATFLRALSIDRTAGDCLVITTSGLEATDCSDDHDFICQKLALACPVGNQLGTEDHCFYLSSSAATWDLARQQCRNVLMGDLAMVSDASMSTSLLSALSVSGPTWIGLKAPDLMAHYLWVNGETPLWSNWYSDATVILQRASGVHWPCVALNTNGEWRETDCQTDLPYICEYSLNDKVDIPQNVARGAGLSSNVTSISALTPYTSALSGQAGLSVVMPGVWFASAGQVTQVNLQMEPNAARNKLAVQVLRPVCPSSKEVIRPGCDNNMFAKCGTSATAAACPSTPVCSADQYPCLLSDACEQMATACSCAGMSSVNADCSATAPDPDITYELVGQVRVEVPQASSAGSLVSLDLTALDVQAGDVMGFQTSETSLGFCHDDMASPWQQAVFQDTNINWMSMGDVVSLASSVRSDRQVCAFSTVYSQPAIVTLPDSLAYLSYPGPHTFTADMAGTATSESCSANIVQAVGELVWLYPVLTPAVPNSYIAVEAGVSENLVAMVASGSPVDVTWSLSTGQSGSVTLSSSCPSSVSSIMLCQEPTSQLESPFIVFTDTMPSSSAHPVLLELNVTNVLGGKSLTVEVFPVVRVQDLVLYHSGCSNHSNCQPTLAVGPVHQFMVEKSSGDVDSYIFQVNGTTQTGTTSTTLSHSFHAHGLYIITVNASNRLENLQATLTVHAKVKANMHGARFLPASPVYAEVGKDVTLNVSALIDANAEVTVTWDFGDSTSNSSTTLFTSSSLSASITHAFSTPGTYNVQVTLTDAFSDVNTVTGQVIALTPITNLTITASPPLGVAGNETTFMAHVQSSPAATQDFGHITYTFRFDDASSDYVKTTSHLSRGCQHTYVTNGTYNVSVEASNEVSSVTQYVTVTVQVCPTKLRLKYDGPKNLSERLTFTATLDEGSDLTFIFDFGDGSSPINQSDANISYMYNMSGHYNASVIAMNALCSATDYFHVIVMDADTLVLRKINHDKFVAVNNLVQFEADVVTLDITIVAFTWGFGAGNITLTGTPRATQTFTTVGNHTVFLKVSLDGGRICCPNTSTVVTVQQPVGNVTLTAPTLVSFSSSAPATIHFMAQASSGSDVKFRWAINNTAITSMGANITQHMGTAGIFNISVTGYNEVSDQGAWAMVLVQHVVENVTVTCSNCYNGRYIRTGATDWALHCTYLGTDAVATWTTGTHSITNPVFANTSLSVVGSNTVYLNVSNKVSSQSTTFTLEVQDPITGLNVTTSQATALEGAIIQLTATHNTGTDVRYVWQCDVFSRPPTTSNTFDHHFPKWGLYTCNVTAQNNVSSQHGNATITVLQAISSLGIKDHVPGSTLYVPVNRASHVEAECNTMFETVFTWYILKDQGVLKTLQSSTLTYTFPSIGAYEINLTASNAFSSKTINVQVEALEEITNLQLIASATTVTVGSLVNLSATVTTGSSTMFDWYVNSFPVPTISGPNVSRVFNSPGYIVVSVNVSNALSVEQATVTILVQYPITNLQLDSSFNFSHPYVAQGQEFTFNASLSQGSSPVFTWAVQAPDLTSFQFVGPSLTQNFSQIGAYSIDLNTTNAVSHEPRNFTVYVERAISNLSVSVSPSIATTQQNVYLMASVNPDADPVTYRWMVEGHNKSEASFRHSFQSAGVYPLELFAYNNISSQEVVRSIRVQDAVTAVFVRDCSDVRTSGVPTVVQASARGTNVTFTWLIQLQRSNITGTGFSLSLTFPTAGRYPVTVSAANAVSQMNNTCQVHVQAVVSGVSVSIVHPPANYIFTNQNITFLVIGNNLREATFNWTFTGHAPTTTSINTFTAVFPAAQTVTLIVEVSNVVSNASDTITFTVQDLKCNLPFVSPVGATSRTIRRSQSAQFDVYIDNQGCTEYLAIHTWQVFDMPDCTHSLPATPLTLTSVETTKPTFILPAMSLPATRSEFCVRYTMGYENTPVAEEVLYNLTILPSPLKAIIAGGNERMVDGTLGILTLDASLSYNPDMPETAPSGMLYTWNCTVVSGSGTCFSPVTNANSTLIMTGMVAGQYNITLTVTHPDHMPDTTYQIVNLLVRTPPALSVGVECVSCHATQQYGISSSHHTALSAHCYNCSCPLQYSWSVKEDNSTFITIGPTDSSTGTNAANLVVFRNTVLKDYSNYTFTVTVTCQNSTGSRGSASITLLPNEPPSNGTCSATPTTIEHLTHTVTVGCSGWVDADSDSEETALLYEVKVERDGESYLLYYGTRQTQSVYLAPWPGTGTSATTLVVSVLDEAGARTEALRQSVSFNYTNMSGSNTSQQLLASAQTMLPALMQQGDPVPLLQYAVALTQLLNSESTDAALTPGSQPTEDLVAQTLARAAITVCVSSGVPISSLQQAQQLAYLLDLLTEFSAEYQTSGSHELIIQSLQNIVVTLNSSVQPGLDREDFAFHSLLSTAYHLMKAVGLGLTSTTASAIPVSTSSLLSAFPDLVSLTNDLSSLIQGLDFSSTITEKHKKYVVIESYELAETITSIVLESLVLGEQGVTFTLGGINMEGVRVTAGSLDSYIEQNGCRIMLPNSLFTGLSGDEEVLKIMMMLDTNPFTWGYIDQLSITSRVPTLSFKYPNGSDLAVKNLHDSIELIMFSSDSNNYTISNGSLIGSQHYDPQANLDMSTWTLGAGAKKKLLIDVSTGTTAISAAHFQIRVHALPNATDEAGNVIIPTATIEAYLGIGYEASETQYDEFKTITTADMASGVDHRMYTFFIAPQDFKSDTEYSITLVNKDSRNAVNISAGMYLSSCQYFDEMSQVWSISGCSVSDESVPIATVCMCNHLTAFGSSSLVPIDSIRFADLASLELGLNPVALATICCLLVLYIIVVVVCRYLDRADLCRISLVPLCGRDGAYKYHITVTTGRQMGAGTTAHVGIKLYGENGKSEPRHLMKSNAFQRNSCDSFLIATDNELGRLHKLRIWHDNAGSAPCWYLTQIVVRDLQSGQRYIFPACTWLSLQMEDGMLQKEIRAADAETLHSFSHVFTTTLSNSWAERHMWLSVFNRPDHSRFTRVQRATCCITLIYLYMFVNALWYGLIKDQADAAAALTWDAFGWEEVIIGLVSVAVVFPIALVLICIFKRSRSKPDMFNTALRPQSAQTIEIDAMCDMSQYGGSLRTMTPNEDWMTLFERESTTESIPPISSQLRRTAPVNRSSRDISSGISSGSSFPGSRGKSTVQCIRRTQDLMWCQENILKSWPEKLPSFAEEEKERSASNAKPSTSSAAPSKTTTTTTTTKSTSAGSNKSGAASSKSNVSPTKSTTSIATNKSANAKTPVNSKPASKTASFTSTASSTASGGKQEKGKANTAKSEASTNPANAAKLPPKPPASSTIPRKSTSFKTETEADSDEEFMQRLDEIDRELQKTSNKAKGSAKSSVASITSTPALKKRSSSSQGAIDDLFDSDDEWTNEGIDSTVRRRPEFNPRQDAHLDRRASINSLLRLRAASMHVPSSAGGSTRDGSFLRRDSTFMRRDSTMHSFMMSEKSRTTLSAMLRNRMQVLNPPSEERGCRLPWFCVYIGYTICLILSVLSIIMVLLYGYNFGPAIALKWLLSLFITFLLSIFVLEPVKVLLMSLFVAIVVKDAEKDMESGAIDVQPLVEANEQLKEVKFRPLGGFALLQAQDEGRRKQRLAWMVRQTIAYVVLTAVLLAVAHVYFGTALYRSTDHIENTIIYAEDGTNGSLSFYNISSQDEWWSWSQDVLAPGLYRYELVTDQENAVLLGPARLRQIRGTFSDCLTTKVEDIRQCIGKLDFTEDTESYTVGWNDSTTGNASWIYSSPEQLNTRAKFGESLLYRGGGYVQELGTSYNQTLSTLQQLFASEWLDRRSRALFVEWTMYSAASDLFSCVTLLLEFPVSGGVLVSHNIITQRLFIYTSGRVDPLYVCQVLLLIPTIYLLIHTIMMLCQQRTQFVHHSGNWLQLAITTLSLTCVAFYIACVVMATETFNSFASSKATFANFERVAHQHDVLRYLHAFLLFLIFVKIAGQVRFIRPLSVFIRTLGAACSRLTGATLIFLILLLTYTQIGYLFFGSFLSSYRSFQNSLVTMLGVVRGGESLSAAYDYHPIFSPFFFCSFYALVYGIFVALVIAILQDAYKLTRSQMYFKSSLEPQDYEMIEFMLKRFKLWAGFTKPKPAFRRVKFEGLPSLPSRDSSSAASSWRPTSQRSTPTPDLIPPPSNFDALDALIPKWEKLLTLLGTVEAIEKEEQRQVKNVESAVDTWCTTHKSPQRKKPPHKKCGGPTGKPPMDPNSKFFRFRSNFPTNSNNEQGAKSAISILQDKPQASSSLASRPAVAQKVADRPASDQGARTTVLPDRPSSDSQKIRPVAPDTSQTKKPTAALNQRPGSDSQKQRPTPADLAVNATASKSDRPNSETTASKQGAPASSSAKSSAEKESSAAMPGFPVKQPAKVPVKRTSTEDSKKQAWDG